jgi:thymidylate synthase ThyX
MYYKAYQAIHEELKEQKVLSPRDMEIVAKEDARYLLPLCTYTQFGMTINARNLEYMIRKCYLSKLDEVKEFGKLLLSKTQAIAPSLIRFVDPSEFEKYACDYSNDIIGQTRLIFTTPDAKNLLLDLHKCNFLLDENIVLGKYDRLPREFELIDIIFDVYLSAACFGQLKRHRMTTQLSGKYNPYLGYKIPSSIPESIINEFVSVLSFASQEYNKLKNNVIAQYILPNATYKRMIFKTNLREFYHITKLRMDEHAQWDIRHLITELKRMYLESKDSIDIWNQ